MSRFFRHVFILTTSLSMGIPCLAERGELKSMATPEFNVQVVVTPSTLFLRSGQSANFHATVTGAKSQQVLWWATQGSITPQGIYTASGVQAKMVTVLAQWKHAHRIKGTATVHVLVAPTDYPTARTDQNVEQLPAAMPAWGGAYGISTTWANPAFNGLRIVRCTDSSTANQQPQASIQTADSGEMTLWSVDSRHLIVKGTGGHKYVQEFDPDTMTCTPTPIDFAYDSVVFSHSNPTQMYALDGTQVRLLEVNADWRSVVSDTVIHDFASCLPKNFGKMTWNGTFNVALEDNSFRVAFSNTYGQGSGTFLAAYQAEPIGTVAAGCYLLDTASGIVYSPAGVIGSVDDGVNPLADRFTMHEGGGGQNPQYSMVSYSVRQPNNRSSGCLAGDCKRNNPYVWEIGTTHLRTCPIDCDGHSAKGYRNWAMGKHYRLHEYADPKSPLTPLVNFPSGFPDQHGSWINTTEDDTPPAFLVSTDHKHTFPYPTWGYNEVLAVATDGTQRTWRFGQTLNSGLSPYFIIQNAVGIVSQDGRWMAFASDMCGRACPTPAPLGYEMDGKTPRGDVFIMEAK